MDFKCYYRSDSLHTVTYEGHDHRMILQDKDNIRHPFALTMFGSNIYWTDWGINALVSVSLICCLIFGDFIIPVHCVFLPVDF